MHRFILGGLAVLLLVPAFALPVSGMCICVPCDDCELRSAGQMNFVVMDRDRGSVTMIPNIRIVGQAEDFALVVPTPSPPLLSPAPANLWTQALDLTAPVAVQSISDNNFGCGARELGAPVAGGFEDDTSRDGDDGVDILGSQSVGAFDAVTLQSDDPRALLDWLVNNGYDLEGVDEATIAPLVEDGWVFTAMKLDTDRYTPPPTWDANVEPVRFDYDVDSFEVPLPFFTINRAGRLPMAFWVVDDHRADFDGFTTRYANQVSRSELQAMERDHPDVAELLGVDRWLTRLDRTFVRDAEMTEVVPLVRAKSDAEFRRTFRMGLESFPGVLLMLTGLLLGFDRLVLRRRARA